MGHESEERSLRQGKCYLTASLRKLVASSFVLDPSLSQNDPCMACLLPGWHRTPQLTLFLAIGGYLVFLVFFLPLYAISLVLTAGGAWAVLLGVVYAGGRGLTQTISYAGASKQIQREMELEYTKNVSSRLVSLSWS